MYETRLRDMEATYAKTLDSLKRLEIMDLNSVKLGLNEKVVITDLKDYWEFQLSKCNLAQQHSLRVRIQSLKQEIALNTKVSAKWQSHTE